MRNIKLTIEYDGKRYSGWQRLGDDDKTIQGKIEKVLHQMTNEEIEIIGSGRTDAGTHARGQVANFKTNTEIGLAEMIDFMNRYLPRDIVIKRIEEMPERFHSTCTIWMSSRSTAETSTMELLTRRVPPGRSLGRKSTMDGWFRAHSTSSLPEVGEPIIRSDWMTVQLAVPPRCSAP